MFLLIVHSLIVVTSNETHTRVVSCVAVSCATCAFLSKQSLFLAFVCCSHTIRPAGHEHDFHRIVLLEVVRESIMLEPSAPREGGLS